MKNLEGKYAIVTGAARGIGAAIAKKFLKNGAAGVALWDMNGELLEKTATELDPERTRTLVVACNISDYEQVKAAVAKTVEAFGTIDVLVNNAGITRDAMLHKMTEEQWMQVMNVNLTAIFYVCREVLPIMREKEYGKVVNISSTAAEGNIGQANYSSTKAAVRGFTYTLAKESGPKNITVNAVAPDIVQTDMLATVPDKVKEGWMAGIPLKRFALPEDIANVVYFLSTDESAYVSGQCITVSGGRLH